MKKNYQKNIDEISKIWDGIIWVGDFNSRGEGHNCDSIQDKNHITDEKSCKTAIFDNIKKGNYDILKS